MLRGLLQFTVGEGRTAKTFIRKGQLLSVEGPLRALTKVTGDDNLPPLALEVRVEEVIIQGRAPPPSMEIIEISDDSPLRGKGKGPAVPSTPLRFSYSAYSSTRRSAKRPRIEDSDDTEQGGEASGSSSSLSSLENSTQPEDDA